MTIVHCKVFQVSYIIMYIDDFIDITTTIVVELNLVMLWYDPPVFLCVFRTVYHLQKLGRAEYSFRWHCGYDIRLVDHYIKTFGNICRIWALLHIPIRFVWCGKLVIFHDSLNARKHIQKKNIIILANKWLFERTFNVNTEYEEINFC